MNNTQLTVDRGSVRRTDVEPDIHEAGRIRLTIDGVAATVDAGTSIFEAARLHGIQIPVLCHQQNERPVGVCRMCSVEAGERTLSAACVRSAEDGMVVQTNSPKVKQARRVLLELLLADHPSPCARQRQSADCELEALALEEGVLESRFGHRTAPRGQDDSSAAISVDHDACILCDRCVRACNEVRHNNVLGRKGKGYQAGIAFDLNNPMGDSSCISCGECMVSCPTGALTNKSVVKTALPEGQTLDVQFLKQLPYFEEISGTFLELNKNAIVLRRFKAGEVICREGEYGSTAFFILEGEAEMFLQSLLAYTEEKPKGAGTLLQKVKSRLTGRLIEPGWKHIARSRLAANTEAARLGPGDLFGETSCVNHYPRSETVRAVTDCVMLEMLRNVLDMMLQRNRDLRALLDSNYRSRGLRTRLRSAPLFASLSDEFVDSLKDLAKLVRVLKGEAIFREGDSSDSFYLIRTGFVKISEKRPDGEMVMAYLGPRDHFGLASGRARTVTATALHTVDLVRIRDDDFDALIERFPEDQRKFEAKAEDWQPKRQRQAVKIDIPLKSFLNQGLAEANSVLLLDLEKCTRCDNCVRACADAHDGVTRLVREGLRFDKYLVATSCRQCRDPLCMVGCPVGSIRRRNSLEIVIEDWCIGCGLCATNCPYGNINMHSFTTIENDPLAWNMPRPVVKQKATSCDLCSGLAEPSCVYVCPHDAAQRVDAVKFFGILPGADGAALR